MVNLNLESERLIIKPLEEGDLDLAIELFTDSEVMEMAGTSAISISEVKEEMPLSVRRCAAGAIGVWSIVHRDRNEKVGSVFLLPMPIEKADTDWGLVSGDQIPDCDIEIGYYVKKSAWGRGIATEACRRLLQFAFEETDLDEIVAVTDKENRGSQKVLIKSGMSFVGPKRAYGTTYPGFSIQRAKWLSQRPQ